MTNKSTASNSKEIYGKGSCRPTVKANPKNAVAKNAHKHSKADVLENALSRINGSIWQKSASSTILNEWGTLY